MDFKFIKNFNYIIKYISILLIGLFSSVYLTAYFFGLIGTIEYLDEKNYVLDCLPVISDNIDLRTDGLYEVLDTYASVIISPKNINYYSYFILDITSDAKNDIAKVDFYDDMTGICKTIKVDLSKKEQIITFPSDGASYLRIEFENMEGHSLKFDKLQFRTLKPFEKWGLFFSILLFLMICYFTILIIFRNIIEQKKINLNYYKIVDINVCFYQKIKKIFFEEIKYKNKYYKSIKFLSILAVLIAIFYKMYRVSYINKYYELVVFIGIGLLIITKFMAQDNKTKHEWHNPLVLSWFVLSILMICSELVTNQKMGMVGYFNLIIFGSSFYIIGARIEYEKLIECIRTVIIITFIACIIKCLFFYNGGENYSRYSGIYGNSNQFALYVIVVFAVVISDLDYYIEKEKFKFGIIIDIIFLGFSSCFLWLTQTRTTLIAMVGIVFFWLVKIVVMRKKYKNIMKNLLIIVLLIVTVQFTWNLSIWTINNVSLKNSSEKVIIENIETPLSMTVYAADIQNRVISTLKNASSLNRLSSQRIKFWISHLRNMNLLGHKDYLYMESLADVSPSHNSIIGIMYKYGILAGIPYIIMLCCSFWYALKYFVKNSFKRKNAMLPLNIVSAFILCAMLDTMDERPFWKMLWLVYYLIIGFLMNMENDEVIQSCSDIRANTYERGSKNTCNKLEKYTITIGIMMIIVLNLGKFVCLGVNWWQTRVPPNSIYTDNILDNVGQNAPIKLLTVTESNELYPKEEKMPEGMQGSFPDYVENNGFTYLYFQNLESKQISLAASIDDSKWETYSKSVLEPGKLGTFDDTAITKAEVIYLFPYYYMFYIGENMEGQTGLGLATSNDGIKWNKKNIKGSFKETNIKDIETVLDSESAIITLKYKNDLFEIVEAQFNVSQNRDMSEFDTEADWSTSLITSDSVLKGSYGIEGETGSKGAWMQSEASIDLYYLDGAETLHIKGEMPLDLHMQKDVDAVNMVVRINGTEVYTKTFEAAEPFDIVIPIDDLKTKSDFMHIQISTDSSVNLSELGVSADERDLSYRLFYIKQE
ncbi:MAG: hypothetical protein ACERKZ_04095 [Lachnotalea sp.]